MLDRLLVFHSCVVNVNGVSMLANLMLLEMTDFDVILGMDWLVSCQAIVDCHAKAVRFDFLGSPSFDFKGDSCLTPVSLISSMSTFHLMNKGSCNV